MDAPFTLRRYRESDAVELLAAVRESCADLTPWMVWCRPDYSLVDAAAWIRHTLDGHESGSSREFAIVDGHGSICGGCGINHINSVDRFANVGYWVRSSRCGRGIAVTAARALIEWAFANTELNRLEIVVAIDNIRSQRVAEKVGATREAVLRQRLMVRGIPTDAVMNSVIRPQLASA